MSSLGEKVLQEKGVEYTVHEYDYRKKGVEAASEALGLPLAAVFKSLVIALPDGTNIFYLVPGGRSVSMKKLARALGVKGAELASERNTERVTGYRVGGIGPFGARTYLPVYVDLSVLDHEKVFVNGGRRGLLLGLTPEQLLEASGGELLEASQGADGQG